MIENKETSFNSILDALNKLSNSFTLPVFIPSLKESIEFKELNAKQQKKLLETITDTSLYKTQFTKVFLDIIKENILTEGFDIEKLTIYDKIFIGLFLRSKISNTLNVIFNENPVYSENISLEPILEKTKSYVHPSKETINVVKNGTKIEVELDVPSMILESKYEIELSKTSKKIENVKNMEEIGNVLSEAFIGEVSKFITKISFDDNNIELNSLTINQRIKLTELLSADLTQKILQKIADWKVYLEEILKVSSSDLKYNKVISIDNLLFLM
jgi:hypothetical protein